MASPDTIVGSWLNPDGGPVANGYLLLTLSQPCVITANGQIAPTTVLVKLDANGSIPANTVIYGNDQLTPSGTVYYLKVENAAQQTVWSITASLVGASPINLNTLVPSGGGGPSYPNPVLQNPSQAQSITGFPLTLTSSVPLLVQGTATFTGPSTACQGNGQAFMDAANVCGWAGTTADQWFTSAVNYLGANGGILYMGPGVFTSGAGGTFTVNTSVKVFGQGQDGITTAGSSTVPATIINCNVVAGPCVLFSAVSGAGNPLLKGCGLENVAIQGNDNASIGLEILSTRNCRFANLYISNATTVGMKLGVVAALADTRDVQYNHFENIQIIEGVNAADIAADAVLLTGDAVANTSNNYFNNIRTFHTNGVGWHSTNSDDNVIVHLVDTVSGGGTGKGVYLAGTGVLGTSPREEIFIHMDLNGSCYFQDNASTGNIIEGYTLDNTSCQPTVSSGSLIYTENGVGASDNFIRIVRGSGTTSNMLQFDSSSASQSEGILFSDNGTAKWTVGMNASDELGIFDAVQSVQRFYAKAGANADNQVNPTGSGKISLGGPAIAQSFTATLGTVCTNGELALSGGWGSTATVTAVAGTGQTCQWTITSNGAGAGANPTITDTLTNALPSASTVCDMRMVGGTGTSTLINQTTLSATAPIFTFGGTPAGGGATYILVRRCGP